MHGEETSARGSSESPCRAFHPLNFPPRAQSKNRRSNSRPPVRMPPNEPAKAVPKGDALQHMYSCFRAEHFLLDAAWVRFRAERPSVSGVNRQLHVQIGCKLGIRNRKDELTKQTKRNKLQIKPEGN